MRTGNWEGAFDGSDVKEAVQEGSSQGLGRAWRPFKLPDGRYARFSIKFYAGDRNFIVFESYLNPTRGSRNLEFDPQKLLRYASVLSPESESVD